MAVLFLFNATSGDQPRRRTRRKACNLLTYSLAHLLTCPHAMTDVAILMTVYNGMPYLPAAVESVLAQTLRDFRFVIVNDGSTDGTADYLQPHCRRASAGVAPDESRDTAAAANHGLAVLRHGIRRADGQRRHLAADAA